MNLNTNRWPCAHQSYLIFNIIKTSCEKKLTPRPKYCSASKRKFLFKTDFYDDLAGFNYFFPPINICSLLKQFSPFETRRLPSPPTLCGLKVAQIKSNIPTKTLLFKPTVIVFSVRYFDLIKNPPQGLIHYEVHISY